jgi:Fe-S oxidoreductase
MLTPKLFLTPAEPLITSSSLFGPPPNHWLLGWFGTVLYVAFAVAAIFFMLRSVMARFRLMQVGRPSARFDRLWERTTGTIKFAIAQARMPNYPLVGYIHIIVFWCFLIIVMTNLTLILQGVLGHEFELPLIGRDGLLGHPYHLLLDTFEVLTILAVTVAIFNRLFVKPSRLTESNEAILILGFIGSMMIADLFYQSAAGLIFGHKPVGIGGMMVTALIKDWSVDALYATWSISWWVHTAVILIFGNILPYSKHFHVITSVPNVFFRDLDGPKKLSTYKIDMENGVIPRGAYGISQLTDLTWKDNLDFYTCTECGRCSDNCPANLSGKPLSPKHLTIALRNHLYHNSAELEKQKGKASDPKALDPNYDPTAEKNNLVPLILETDILWSCTTCRACEVACPVFISYVDKIVDMRRWLVGVEAETHGAVPKELKKTFQNMENKSNPWGQNESKRDEWYGDLPVRTFGVDAEEAEYLYYVGCAAAFDDRAKKVAQAVVKILNAAKVDYAILGSSETCNGDSARRSGNEYLFQTMATMLIDTLKGHKFKKIVTACPHCFNTLKNEYPEFGASYEVVHHSELIDKLMWEGKLAPRQSKDLRVVFHDSCYLGRYNEVYDQPRGILERSGYNMVEATRTKKTGLCCGAGGARMWMEEKVGSRMNQERFANLMETEPQAIAVACPFCMTMISDAAKDKDSTIPVYDVAELVAASLPVLQEPSKEAAE